MKGIINNQEIELEIMSSPRSKQIGMMYRDDLNGGMLFLFDGVGERSFWMKNCNIPLDIVFLVGNRVTNVSYDCVPCEEDICKSYHGIADKVLELPSGEYDINQGDIIEFVD